MHRAKKRGTIYLILILNSRGGITLNNDKPRVKRITFGKIMRWFGVSIIVFIYSCIIIRSFVSCDVELTERVIYNGNTVKAYENEDEVYVEKYPISDFWRSIGANQLLMIDNLYYSPLARQMQVSVKYNTSYADAPTSSRIPFGFYLLDEVGTRYEDYFFKTDLKNGYGYIRVCFEGIDIIKSTPSGDERKIYTLFIEQKNEDGGYEPLESFPLYDGGEIFEKVPFDFGE